ncbi:hypothetical protein CK203_015304 [Vitis vinifera]|uniref:DUF659 domain-containing protein n=1 Tax=Vitis vinifera TaxID=29760 RepID=A0A438JK69_VITVI|nr:hypothetical protein CK203_015304 [Vitis vinifera]
MKPCNKVSEDARLECKEALANFKDQKTKRNELLQEIGMGPTSRHESALSKTIGTLGSGSGSGSGSVSGNGEPIPRGPMDKFTTSQPRQNVVANFGLEFKPPSMHELRTWILKEEVNDLSIIMEDHKKAWKQYGCSIMSDGWTDGKSRCLINFLVNSPAGTWFMKSIDASDTIKNGELMFKYLDEVVEEIGEENVVQVITDNASNYDIGKLNVHATALSRARQVVKFIYGHTWILSLMRTFTKNHELIRPAITRFATAFLTLQSLYKQKQALIAMFSLEKWCSSTWAKKTTVPLVSVLREVDSEERPAMGYIYELMDSAKEKIAFNSGYYLNPQLQYGDKFSNVDEVRKGLFECMDRMLDYQERLKVDIQLDLYDQAMGEFGSRIAIDSRTLRSPTSWWMRFEGSTSELQKYNTRLRERSLQRKQNVDPILVEEIDSDDEWIAEKEDPLLPLDLCWLQDNELFNVDAIRVVSSNSQEMQASSDHMVSSHSYKRKHNEVPSTSGGKGKEKELNLTPIDEDEDLDEMGIHDSGHFPTIDTLDEDDDDLGEEDLS